MFKADVNMKLKQVQLDQFGSFETTYFFIFTWFHSPGKHE